jgi:hypothetical protein
MPKTSRKSPRPLVEQIREQAPVLQAYDEKLAREVLDMISAGASLAEVERRIPGLRRKSVYEWIWDDVNGFATRYARAREMQMEAFADDTIEIADSARDSEEAAIARVRIASRQWLMTRLLSKKYGDKVTTEHKFTNPLKTITGEMTDEQAAAEWARTVQES